MTRGGFVVDGVAVPLQIESHSATAIETFLDDPDAAVEEYLNTELPQNLGFAVNFVSEKAESTARTLALTAEDFAGYEGSGKDGAFTVKDVHEIHAELHPSTDEEDD